MHIKHAYKTHLMRRNLIHRQPKRERKTKRANMLLMTWWMRWPLYVVAVSHIFTFIHPVLCLTREREKDPLRMNYLGFSSWKMDSGSETLICLIDQFMHKHLIIWLCALFLAVLRFSSVWIWMQIDSVYHRCKFGTWKSNIDRPLIFCFRPNDYSKSIDYNSMCIYNICWTISSCSWNKQKKLPLTLCSV